MEKSYLSIAGLIKALLLYTVGLAVFYTAAHHQIWYTSYDRPIEAGSGTVGEIIDGKTVRGELRYDGDYIREIRVKVGTYVRSNTGRLQFCLTGSDGGIVWQEVYDVSQMEDNQDFILHIRQKLPGNCSRYFLAIVSKGCAPGNAVTLYTRTGSDELAVSIYGDRMREHAKYFWLYAMLAAAAVALCYVYQMKQERDAKTCMLHAICQTLDTYRFMIKQLVSRDFKTKYKRSVLGAFWSFLNPLLTMAVQYVVFSTIFRSSIDNYPVYLLSASILFNYFTESVGGGLVSIVGNASLISKVYVPKYIYPVTKVLSTAINLLISMLPLFAVVWMTGEPVTGAYVLLPYVVVCLLLFCTGMSLFMAALMVYFRDMQFLWGIVSLLWMYATPMFYPEEIIPERFRMVLDLNPMYHYISFFRTILLEHTSPQMGEYLVCLVFSLVFCTAGALFFNHFQKDFVLYL
ncbi:MAG: ABC transporter permease [Eubacterium sp.]|nr:ABC transporter permease [Eubacterium sp.]